MRKLLAIGRVTFFEVLRDKILYNVLLCALLLLGVGFFASRLTFIRPERILLDFGLSAILISCSMIAILLGSVLLIREFERRTAYVALSHPITRGQFVWGKFFGLSAVILLNWFLLSGVYIGSLYFSGGSHVISKTLFFGIGLALIQSLLLASLSVLISTFSTTSLSVIISIGFYLIGNNISQMRFLATKLESPFVSKVLNWGLYLLPNLEYFNFGTKVTYALPVSWQFVGLSSFYGLSIIALFLAIAGFLIQSREV